MAANGFSNFCETKLPVWKQNLVYSGLHVAEANQNISAHWFPQPLLCQGFDFRTALHVKQMPISNAIFLAFHLPILEICFKKCSELATGFICQRTTNQHKLQVTLFQTNIANLLQYHSYPPMLYKSEQVQTQTLLSCSLY